MSFKPCPQSNEGCRFYETELGCVTNEHHIYWPKKRYTTPVEREFRNLPENKVDMCLSEHRDLHATERPPVKPSRELMIQAIASHMVQGEVA